MKTTPIPAEEVNRLKALRNLKILDTAPEKQFDEVSELASLICETPVALISLLDKNRQWFKSCIGFYTNETEREISFCNYTIKSDQEILHISDALCDSRFKNNPLT